VLVPWHCSGIGRLMPIPSFPRLPIAAASLSKEVFSPSQCRGHPTGSLGAEISFRGAFERVWQVGSQVDGLVPTDMGRGRAVSGARELVLW
jgi:hypothetical protein